MLGISLLVSSVYACFRVRNIEAQGWKLKGLGTASPCVDTSLSLDSQENCV